MSRTRQGSTDWYYDDMAGAGADIEHDIMIMLIAGDVTFSTDAWAVGARLNYNFGNAGQDVKQELAVFGISGIRATGSADTWEVILKNVTDGTTLGTLTPSNTSLAIATGAFSLPAAAKDIGVEVKRSGGSGGTYTIKNAWICWTIST